MNSYRLFLGALAVACLGLVTFSGCGQQTTAEGKKKPLPKMDFHKPASFSAAVSRIREIHDTLISEDGLPPSLSYTVKEVSHSHGDTPHVHYHLVDAHGDHDHGHHDHDHGDHDHDDHKGHDHGDHGHDHGEHGDHDHDHDHADPFQPTHRIIVDIFTELNDVAKWLPAIASDGDLPRESWNTSKEVSEKITGHMEEIMQSGLPLIQRTAYQDEAAEIDNLIKKLESLVDPAVTTEN